MMIWPRDFLSDPSATLASKPDRPLYPSTPSRQPVWKDVLVGGVCCCCPLFVVRVFGAATQVVVVVVGVVVRLVSSRCHRCVSVHEVQEAERDTCICMHDMRRSRCERKAELT